ncbi:DinB family protein [Maridesulfovibrio sp. FT414]|uniref:DinB family protein n=1 Tax=Maridesulfovibrio sp. FT414 TaxID=2979469 RepID=UPI003D80969D
METSLINVQIEAVLKGLRESHVILSGLVTDLPDEVLHCRRGDGFWTIAEHAAHLADVQPMGEERIRRILNEDNPEFVPFLPEEDDNTKLLPPPDMKDVLSRFHSARVRIVQLLEQASPEDWQRKAVHPEYRQYGLFIFARHILMHDHWHMYRMEELWLTRDEYLTGMD